MEFAPLGRYIVRILRITYDYDDNGLSFWDERIVEEYALEGMIEDLEFLKSNGKVEDYLVIPDGLCIPGKKLSSP
jgi:hypothetical protein